MSAQGLEVAASEYGLSVGTPELRSVGPIAFGPDGILFVADNVSAAIFAVHLGGAAERTAAPIEVDALDTRLASYLGCAREDVSIKDLAVDPRSSEVILSVMRGAGGTAVPVLVRVGGDGVLSTVELEDVPYAVTGIADAPAEDDERTDPRVVTGENEGEELEVHGVKLRVAWDRLRSSTVTDMAYVDGVLLVAGASNEEFSSTFRRIPFPFGGPAVANSLEIFHVSHGKYETASPIRTFVPYDGGASALASYTCTPVVHFRLSDLADSVQAKGRTVAELGAMNTPLDMVSFVDGGREYLLVANTRHPLIKIACEDVDKQEGLTSPTEPVGVPREDLRHEGVLRMANLGDSHVLMLQRDADDQLNLRTYGAASL